MPSMTYTELPWWGSILGISHIAVRHMLPLNHERKGKGIKYSSLQLASRAIWDHRVLPAIRQRWHSHLYPKPIEAGIQFSDSRGMLGWVDLVGFGYIPRWYTHPKTVTHSSINRAQHRVTKSYVNVTAKPNWPTEICNDIHCCLHKHLSEDVKCHICRSPMYR